MAEEFVVGDVVVCTDTSGASPLEVSVGEEYIIKHIGKMCYIKLVGIKYEQKAWRFIRKERDK